MASVPISCTVGAAREVDIAPGVFIEYCVELRRGAHVWVVWHRFSSFQNLRSQLRPKVAAAAAPLPHKESFRWHSTSTVIVSQRSHALCKWLSAVLEEDRALDHVALLSFLGLLSEVPLQPTVHVSALPRAAQTGDVILFRTIATGPALQRVVTWSHWDHVGMVIFRDRAGRVCAAAEAAECGFIEADASGCRFYSLSAFTENEWHRLYRSVGLRRLETNAARTGAFYETLDRWCGQVLGKPYELTLGKLTHVRRTPRETSGEDVGFFCSELVAHAYQALGLLPATRPASGYWPVTFAAASGLQLQGGARLLGEELVDFRTLGVDTLKRRPPPGSGLCAQWTRCCVSFAGLMDTLRRQKMKTAHF
jgi:hypothetical protein